MGRIVDCRQCSAACLISIAGASHIIGPPFGFPRGVRPRLGRFMPVDSPEEYR